MRGWAISSLVVVATVSCEARPPLEVTDATDASPSYAALAANGACSVLPSSSFQGAAIPPQTGSFTWDFNVQSPANSDLVVGLAPGPVTDYVNLATAVRFNPQG